MSKRNFLFVLSASLFILTFLFTYNIVFAAINRSAGTTCNDDDRNFFPFGYICGSNNNNPQPGTVRISTTPGSLRGSDITVNSGSQINVSGGFDRQYGSNQSGNARWKNNLGNLTDSPELLVWATIDGNDDLLGPQLTSAQDSTSVISITNNPAGSSSSSKVVQCPGAGSGYYSVVYNHRDLQTNGSYGSNQSPAAYDGSNLGKEDCQSQGKMVYWTHAVESMDYKFNINLPSNKTGQVCLTFNLSARFRDSSQEDYFLPDNATNNNGAIDQSSVASHVIQQSRRQCFDVQNPPSTTPKVECSQYSITNLEPHSWYRFSYFDVDYNHMTVWPAPDPSVSASPPGWGALDQVPRLQSSSVFNTGAAEHALNSSVDTDWTYGALGNGASYMSYDTTRAGTAADPKFVMYFPQPRGPDRVVLVERWEHYDSNTSDSDNSFNTWGYTASYATKQNCTVASCSVTLDTGLSTDPKGVLAGQKINGSVTITNTGDDIIYGILGTSHLSYEGVGNGIGSWNTVLAESSWVWKGGYRTIPFTITMPPTTGTYSLSGKITFPGLFDLAGGPVSTRPPWGSGCNSPSVNVYKEFKLTPDGTGNFDDDEDPTAFNFRTWVDNNISDSVPIASYSCVFKEASAGTGDCPPSLIPTVSKNPLSSGRTYYYGSASGDQSIGVPKPITSGNQYCAKLYLPYTSGFVGPGGSVINPIGEFSKNYCDTIKNKPYFKVMNGSIAAGGDFEDTGTGCAGDGVVASFFKHDPAYPPFNWGHGSSVGYSILAKGAVNGVGSRQLSKILSPTELTFANTVNVDPTNTTSANQNMGGMYADAPCLHNSREPASPDANTHIINSDYDINGDINVPTDTNVAYFVHGDVYINGNIYVNGPFLPGHGASFLLKATGNIYIDNDVSNLDGIYIAHPDSSNAKGNIYTCALSRAIISSSLVYNNCAKRLTVHGNFVARKVNMLRTYGSIRDEKPTDYGSPSALQGGHYGITQPLVWVNNSQDQPSGYNNCVKVNEPSEPRGADWLANHPGDNTTADHGWDNNWLCVAKADEDKGINLRWTHTGDGPTASEPYCSATFSEEVINLGFAWTEPYTWQDNKLCSSAGVYFRAGYETTIYNTTPNMICTKITEPNDPDYYSIWAGNTSTGSQSLYICMDKYVPGTPIDAQPPSGPNPLRCSIPSGTIIDNSGTCAAEVYEFSPELYMSRPKDSVNQDGPIIFNSITSLPPVL